MTRFEESSRLYSINIVEQALAVRGSIIDLVKNDKLLLDLYFISTNAKTVVFVQAKGKNVFLHMVGRDPEPVDQQIKTINTFFSETYLVRINRSTLINTKKVKNVNRISSRKITVEMATKEVFAVSRGNQEKVRLLFGAGNLGQSKLLSL